MIYILVLGWLLIAYKVRRDYLNAHRRYNITKRRDIWTVRDSKGRFVTLTDNYWNICKLGA